MPCNYRPVTLTSIVCKLLEEIITEHIRENAIRNNTQDKAQHGFTKQKSTVTNLIEALNVWTEALSHGLPVDIVYLDFEKAFDKVPHKRLLKSTLQVRSKRESSPLDRRLPQEQTTESPGEWCVLRFHNSKERRTTGISHRTCTVTSSLSSPTTPSCSPTYWMLAQMINIQPHLSKKI